MTTLRICFVGDSITQGTIDPDGLGWPGRLGNRERAAGHDVTVYNLGVRADTAADIAGRWRAEAEARLPDAYPGALVFAFGVNDMAEEPETGLRVPPERSCALAREIVAAARDWKPVLWVGPAPSDMACQPFSPTPGIQYAFDNGRVAALSTAYAALAAELAVPYLDLYPRLADAPRWSAALDAGDGVHPGPDGYAMMAEIIGNWAPWRGWFD